MIRIKSKGDWKRTDRFFKESIKISKIENITLLAEKCIERLKVVTPKDSGITSDSWSYEIVTDNINGKKILYINNTNIQNGVTIVLLLEFGHASSSGSWIEGQKFVTPIIREEYNKILAETWKEMKRL